MNASGGRRRLPLAVIHAKTSERIVRPDFGVEKEGAVGPGGSNRPSRFRPER
jgi:hypothetical protein